MDYLVKYTDEFRIILMAYYLNALFLGKTTICNSIHITEVLYFQENSKTRTCIAGIIVNQLKGFFLHKTRTYVPFLCRLCIKGYLCKVKSVTESEEQILLT